MSRRIFRRESISRELSIGCYLGRDCDRDKRGNRHSDRQKKPGFQNLSPEKVDWQNLIVLQISPNYQGFSHFRRMWKAGRKQFWTK
jgi:hypothetical protein